MQAESNIKLPAVVVEINGKVANVIIRKNFREETREEQTIFICDEVHGQLPYYPGLAETIEKNIQAWYEHLENVPAQLPTTSERLERMERTMNALMEYQGLTVRKVANGVLEVVKSENPLGSYLNPIKWFKSLVVKQGVWYYNEDKDLPAEALKSGVALAWSKEWFDIVG